MSVAQLLPGMPAANAIDLRCSYCGSAHGAPIKQKTSWTETEPFFAPGTLYRCEDCGLYHTPMSAADRDGMARYFAESYNITRTPDAPRMVHDVWGGARWPLLRNHILNRARLHKWRFTGLEPDFGPGRYGEMLSILTARRAFSVLDIGCSYGAFVKVAFERGFDAYGIEPTRETVQSARALGARRMHHGFFPEQSGPRAQYDALVFMHSLTYMNLTSDLLAAARSKLKGGGTLVVFCSDPHHIGNADMDSALRSPIAINFTGKQFMQRAAADLGYVYDYQPCRAEPLCCFHVLRRA